MQKPWKSENENMIADTKHAKYNFAKSIDQNNMEINMEKSKRARSLSSIQVGN